MPELKSKYFGHIIYQPQSLIEFPRGLPGFEEEQLFVLVEQPVSKPIVFLQSLRRPEVCFITVPAQLIYSGYEFGLSEEERAALDLAEGQTALALVIVSIAEAKPPTVNLLSPIIVNWRARRAVQAIQADSPYSHQHPLFAETAGAPCS